MTELSRCCWPVARLGDALAALANRRVAREHNRADRVELPAPPISRQYNHDDNGEVDRGNRARDTIGQWLERATSCLGLEAEPVEILYAEIEPSIGGSQAMIIQLPGDNSTDGIEAARFLVLWRGGHKKVTLLAPDLSLRRVAIVDICAALAERAATPLLAGIDRLLQEAGVSKRHQRRARQTILNERLASTSVGSGWVLRLPPGANFWLQAREAGVLRRLAALLGAHTLQYLLLICSWVLIGKAALEGYLAYDWLIAWALMLFTLVPLRMYSTWLQGLIAISLGGLLKQRLLYGALRLAPEEIRHQGTGQLLGRVMESEALESLALSGGFQGLLAIVELLPAIVILTFGAGGLLPAVLLLGTLLLTLIAGWRYYRQARQWTGARLEMTDELVERMVGHRTRLAQQSPARWHDGEDQLLADYQQTSGRIDRISAGLLGLIPRGWLIGGLVGIAPTFISSNNSTTTLAISFGGILLAMRALAKLTTSISQLSAAAIAWQQVAPLFHAAGLKPACGSAAFAFPDHHNGNKYRENCNQPETIVEAHELVFRYRDQGEPVLNGCSLRIAAGDRLLLEGASGGGKSTFAALLTGLRESQSGLLLLRGLDRATLGAAGWRQVVVAAPQFHENHVLTGTFLFNLLMGRAWPPRQHDIADAERVCHELGLSDLLARMPAGLMQMVGETGWQLSHGERSRLFIARALLQQAELIVLDESFAALDPETLQGALHCVRARAGSLLVIAHP